MKSIAEKAFNKVRPQSAVFIGLLIAVSACQASLNSDADAQSTQQSAMSNVALETSPHRVYFARGVPGPELLSTGALWMPFLRQPQINEWNEDETVLTFRPEIMERHIRELMPLIEERGYLMLDLESGPRAQTVGRLDEWVTDVNEAIRYAAELCPEGTIVGSYPSPSHVRRFTDDSFRVLDNSTGLFFPIHTMNRARMEAFAQRIDAMGQGEKPVIAYLWQFMDPPANAGTPTEPSLWEDQGAGEWVPERMIRERVNDALDLFNDVQIVVRGKGPQAARAVELAQEVTRGRE